eukprot:GHVT01070163.1.p1 GENE.GHVT01070163.1~~GHVT01070163.1.p1  ORF type:complete len:218 (+),score=36.37 GHVT01070163.1:438-1091(+)
MKPVTHKRKIEHELEGFGIRLNKLPPNINVKKKDKGGVVISTTCPLKNIDEETIRSICHEYRIMNAQISIRQDDCTADDIIDAIEGNRLYVPCIYVMNKIDQITIEELEVINKMPHYSPVSAHHEWNLDGLLEKMWQYMNLVRIYTKPKGQIPDYNAPVILRHGQTRVEDFCLRIHKSLLQQFRHALVWGKSVKHTPQKVGKDHVLVDEDVVQISKR